MAITNLANDETEALITDQNVGHVMHIMEKKLEKCKIMHKNEKKGRIMQDKAKKLYKNVKKCRNHQKIKNNAQI